MQTNDAKYRPEWGTHNLMVLAAFRYCLGRRSYITKECSDWLILYWDQIDECNKKTIVTEIKEAIANERAGDQCDIAMWMEVIANAETE